MFAKFTEKHPGIVFYGFIAMAFSFSGWDHYLDHPEEFREVGRLCVKLGAALLML